MGKIALQIKANLTNVDALYPESRENFNWNLKVKCTICGEENQSWHTICRSERIDISHNHVNFLYKCKCCKYENKLTILEENRENLKQKGHSNANVVCKEYSSEDDGQFRTLIIFECRGMEPIEFEPRGGWAVRSGEKTFSDVDLTENEWCEYNDQNNLPVEISNFESKFVGVK